MIRGGRPSRRARGTSGRRGVLALWVASALLVVAAAPVWAHEGEHADPELLNHWRTLVHLGVQWAHLVAFALWLGGMTAATRLPGLTLERLLFASWALFLVSLGSGSYNMEFGAATPESPDVLSLPALWRRYPFGAAYIILIGVKQALLGIAALLTLVVTVWHVRRPPGADRARLRRVFVGASVGLGLALAAAAALVLVLHEAVDLAPTPLHSMGGVVGPRGPEELAGLAEARAAAPPPYGGDLRAPGAGFGLLALPAAVRDAVARFGHLVGFALWLGGTAAMLITTDEHPTPRVLPFLWLGLAVLAVTGTYQLVFWTPFARPPWPWRLSEMTHVRFGYTYTLLLAIKLGLAALGAAGTAALARAARPAADRRGRTGSRGLAWLNLGIGLALAYVAMALLLVHEGVDHAL